MAIDPTTKPNLAAFIEAAISGGDDVEAEIGDGSILAAIKQILEMLAPFIVMCAPSKAAFTHAAHRPTRSQKLSVLDECLDQARKIDGLGFVGRLIAARSAQKRLFNTARVYTTSELESVHADLAELQSELTA